MYVKYLDNKSFNIFLFDENKIKNTDNIKENPEDFFKNIFLTLKNKYHIKLNGMYKIDLYICNDYGIVIEMRYEEDEIFEDYIEGVDLKIKINDECKTLFEIKDVLIAKDEDNIQIFKYNDKFYLMFIDKPKPKQLFKILEHSKIIYGKITKKIINPYNIVKI